MSKVLIADKMSAAAVDIFRQRYVQVEEKTGLTPDELKAIIGNYAGLVIRSTTQVTPEILAAATNLKIIGRAGIGVDNVDVPAATARGIVVMNTPHGNATTTAEHAISMLMALARSIPQASSSTHAGKWEKSKFMGVEITGKTLGIIGCGNIGTIVADRALGLHMKVIAFDPFLSEERAQQMGIEKVSLDDLWPRADFITLHTPLIESTRYIVNAENLAKCKKSVFIINCARGGLVHEGDLLNALNSGQVAGAALDVFEVEPAKENALFGHEKVICTPHLGASTHEAQENVALQIAEQISDYLLTGAIRSAVNTPSVSAEESGKLKPYLELAEQLGTLLGQLQSGPLTSATFYYDGTAAALPHKPLTAQALVGLLQQQLDAGSVNTINAASLAKARGIKLQDVANDSSENYQSLLRIQLYGENGLFEVSGTLFGNTPRIVAINKLPIEFAITSHMLLVRNRDEPGLIGGLGTILAKAKINIANFNLGRNQIGGEALAMIALDQRIDDKLLSEIQSLPQVITAQRLSF